MTSSVSGTVYTDRGVTTMGAGRTLNLSVNGAASSGSTTTASDGTYTISGITAAAAAVITVYLQGNTEVGVCVTRSTGANMTGIDLYQNYLNLRSDDGTALSSTNLNTADNNGATGISSIYSSASNTAATITSGKNGCLMSGQSFTSGAAAVLTLTSGAFYNNGTFTFGAGSSLTLSAGDLTNTGTLAMGTSGGIITCNSFTNSGSYTSGNNSCSIRLAKSAGGTLTSGGASIKTLTISSGFTCTLGDALSVVALNITNAGAGLDVSTNNYSVTCAGAVTITNATFTARSGTFSMTAGGNLTSAGNHFHHLSVTTGGTVTIQDDLIVDGNLTIGASATLSSGTNNVTVGGNWANSGTFTTGTETVTLNGTAQTISGTTTFFNLVCTTNGDVLSFTDGTTTTVTNSVTFQNVTLQGTGAAGWTVSLPATQTIDHVTVSHSTATGHAGAAGTGSVDAGNNVNWTFPSVSGGKTLSGLSGLSGLA